MKENDKNFELDEKLDNSNDENDVETGVENGDENENESQVVASPKPNDSTHDDTRHDHDDDTPLLLLDDSLQISSSLDHDHDVDGSSLKQSTDPLSKKKRLYDDNNVADSSSFNESNASAAKRHHASDDDHFENDQLQAAPPPPPQNQRIGFAGMTHAHPPLPPPTVTYSANPSAHSPAIGPRYSQHQLAPGSGSAAAPSSHNHPSHPNDKPVRFRMLVSTKDAGVIIGHKGVHVTEIKDMIGTVSATFIINSAILFSLTNSTTTQQQSPQ